MKQLLYFLIGVLISGCLFLPLSNACDYDLSDLSWSGNQSGSEYMGTYGSQSAAISARTSHVSPGNLYLFNSSDSVGITNSGGSVVASAVWGFIYDTSDGSYHNCLWVYSYVSGYDICDSSGDSDGDGILDSMDPYDGDVEFKRKLVGIYTDDCTIDGTPVGWKYKTDLGDTYTVGVTSVEDDCFFEVIGSEWQNPVDDPDTDPERADVPDESPEPDDRSGDGQKSDDDDTDTELQKKIADNTSATADNVAILSGYLKDMNKSLSDISNNTKNISADASQSGAVVVNNDSDDDEDDDEDENYDDDKAELEGLDIDSLLGNDINGELVEGEDGDYQDHGKLMEETWVQELISSNPITTVLTNSGFEYSSGSPTATLDLGELGTHTLDISDLEAGFIAFGNLLVSFTTLIGLVHVITGKGF